MNEILTRPYRKKGKSELEFIALMAFLMSNVALTIDSILPALTDIGKALQVKNNNHLQLVIIMVFLGLAVGELIFGTLSDSYGRKPIVYIGVGVFILASIIVVIAPSLEILLLGRVIQGIGLSAARSVSIAIIRDTYVGDRMARIMSFITTVFILVPMIAPLLGQLILTAFNWQAIIYFQLLFIAITIFWFWRRQEETLLKEKRIKISKYLFFNGIKEFFKFKKPIVYSLITGFLNGAFISYLGSAQQIFQEQYQMVDEFPYIFGALAMSFGIATLLNASLVLKYGMIKLVTISTFIYFGISSTYFLIYFNDPNPELPFLLIFLALQFLSLGFVSGNLSALAMQPIGHIAGIGAAIYSFISMILGVVLAIIIGSFIHDTALPLFIGFLLSGLVAIILLNNIRENKKMD